MKVQSAPLTKVHRPNQPAFGIRQNVFFELPAARQDVKLPRILHWANQAAQSVLDFFKKA